MSPRFGRGAPDGDEARAERDARSLASIEAGGLPLPAQERLDALRKGGSGFFTSDLSTSEFLLVREAGFHPLTQVMGSSVYQVGWQQLPVAPSVRSSNRASMFGWQVPQGGSAELDTLSDAWNEARRLAFGRLAEEAVRAGADAVVGVRLGRGGYEWAAGLIEFTSFGTAVRSTRYDLGDEPVLSTVSGQDFAKLFARGWWPAGVVAATSVTYVVGDWASQIARQGVIGRTAQGGGLFSQNQEMPAYTEGIYDARANAMRRIQRQAHEVGAHGVVGVELELEVGEREVDQGNGPRTDLIVTVHALGTAVVQLNTDVDSPTYYALSLKENA